MGSKALASTTLLLSLNLLFFTLVSSNHVPCPPPPTHKHHSPPPPTHKHHSPPPASKGKCPLDTLKLGVCADILGLVKIVIGSPAVKPCCSLIQGIADLEAAICLCTAIKANVLGINLNVPVSLSLILNTCGKKVPSDFQCA